VIRSLLSSLAFLGVGLTAIALSLVLTLAFGPASVSQDFGEGDDRLEALEGEEESELDEVGEEGGVDLSEGPAEGVTEGPREEALAAPEEEEAPPLPMPPPPSMAPPPSAPPPSSPGIRTGGGQAVAADSSSSPVEALSVEVFLQRFNYSAEGRRDPFQPYEELQLSVSGEVLGPLLPLQRFDLDQLKLVGIIWDVADPKAMFLDPSANVHLVGKDDRIGRNNGYIAVIREGEVVVIEATQGAEEILYSSRVLRLSR
jgi:type IV pilus assembly protein PilP